MKVPVESCAKDMKYIVVHNTANDASAANEVAYMIRNDSSTSFNAAVDDKEIVVGIPLDVEARSRQGQRDGNAHGIHIEICYSLSGGTRFDKAEKNAAEYIAKLLTERKWDISHVKKHQAFDGKYCPHRTLDKGWHAKLQGLLRIKGLSGFVLRFHGWMLQKKSKVSTPCCDDRLKHG